MYSLAYLILYPDVPIGIVICISLYLDVPIRRIINIIKSCKVIEVNPPLLIRGGEKYPQLRGTRVIRLS